MRPSPAPHGIARADATARRACPCRGLLAEDVTAAPKRPQNSDVVFVTVAAQGSIAPRVLQQLVLAPKTVVDPSDRPSGGCALAGPVHHRRTVLLSVASQVTVLVVSSSALPAVDRSVVTIAFLAHIISVCTHSSTVPLTPKNECLSPGSILHFKHFCRHLVPC